MAGPLKGVEMLESAQKAFLRRVLGVGAVAQQIARQRVDVVEIGQRGVVKTPRPLHRPDQRLPSCCTGLKQIWRRPVRRGREHVL